MGFQVTKTYHYIYEFTLLRKVFFVSPPLLITTK